MKPAAQFDALLSRALGHATAYLDGLDRSPVAASSSLDALRASLSRPLPEEGMEPVRVLDELVADISGGLNGSAGGRFFGWVIGGSLPAALAADWMASTWDQNAALYACSPAMSVLEETCGVWLKQLLGLPASASFALVTGSQMAHVTCLSAARHALLASRGWDVERQGLCGAPAIRVVSSTEHHGSIERAVRLLGFGIASLHHLEVDDENRLRAESLEESLGAAGGEPTIVVLQAGDISTGSFDSFSDLIPIARRYGAWVHVDGAFGLWVGVSPDFRKFVADIELADSWTTDGHKWLNVPYDCGYAFVADAASHRASNSHRAHYLTHAQDARDQIDWNPEWSRRGRAAATYAAIRELGRQGIASLIERTCRFAQSLTSRIGRIDRAEVLWEPRINQGLVRFLDPTPGATDPDHDRYTDDVIRGILKTGEAFFTGATWHGRRCMRVSVLNWQTTEADVNRAVEATQVTVGETPSPRAR